MKKQQTAKVLAATVFLLGIGLFPFLSSISEQVPSPTSGEYLVESVAICFECHSERDYSKPGWPIPPGRRGSGRILRGEGTPDPIVAPNISPDKESGIGAWTDDEIKRAIIGGIGRDGRQLYPEMPYHYFNLLTAPELDAIVNYLRSIPPAKSSLPKMSNYVPGPNPPRVPMDSIQLASHSEVVKRGRYLVRLAGCETCHTPRNAQGFIQGMEFAGGSVFRHANEEADAASNLTPDPTGIGRVTEQQFIDIIRTGNSGHRALNSAMPWQFYRNMTDSDLKAIFAYLNALPPIPHKIDNTQPPSLCPKCRNQHGLGHAN